MSLKGLIDRYGISVTPYTLTDSTVDGGGAVVRSWASGTAFLLLIQPSAPSESDIAGAVRTVSSARGYCDIAVTLTQGMRIDDGTRVWEVDGFYTPDLRSSPDALACRIVNLTATEGLA